MKLESALVFLALLGACFQVSVCQEVNATVSIASSTVHVWQYVQFNITCSIGSYASLGAEDYTVILSVNNERTQPTNAYVQIGEFVVTNGNESTFEPNWPSPSYLRIVSTDYDLTGPSFLVTLNPLTYDANGFYQCRVVNSTTYLDLVEPKVWDPEFSLLGAANPVVPTVTVSMEVRQVADSTDMQLAKCVTNVAPKYTNYYVYFVANYSMVDSQVVFGYYSVNYDEKSITWMSSFPTNVIGLDQLNFYPQNNTAFYPTFNALIQTKRSVSYIKSQLMCYVRLPSIGSMFLSTSSSGSFALAPSMLALVLLALVKLFNN